MNLLDKYVIAVGKHLPRKNRADIEAELRSTLEDMLEDRSAETNRPVDEALTSELLKEYGAPEKVAAGYSAPRYLIGPRLYPIFELVLKIVITVLFAVSLIGFAIGFAGEPVGEGFLLALGKFWADFLGGMVMAFGNIVLVFAILERVLPPSEFEDNEEGWDPATLNEEPDPDKVSVGETIAGLVFTTIFLAIFNFYPEIVGIGILTEGEWFFIPVLSEAFFRYLPWINLLGVLTIAFNLVMLRLGTWTPLTRIFNIALDLGGIALAYAMITGPALLDLSSMSATDAFGVGREALMPLIQAGFSIALVIVIIISSIEVAKDVYKLIKPRSVGLPQPR